jgi:hypothetical protein
MKRIGPLLFLAALIWTWNIVHSESAIPFSTHVNIQTEFRELLLKSIKEKRPDAQNIQISELWTKESGQFDEDKSEVEVYVTYSFDTPDSEGTSLNKNEITAVAILKKDNETNDSETWILESYKPTRDDIQFTEGLRITAGVSEDPAKNKPEIENANPPTEPNSSNNN